MMILCNKVFLVFCTCSTKGTRAHQRKVSSAIGLSFTLQFIQAGLDFQDRVPILSVLGLPLDMVRAQVEFWSDTDGAKSFTQSSLSVPNQFFSYAYFFIQAVPKTFCRVNGALVSRSKLEQLWQCYRFFLIKPIFTTHNINRKRK